MEIITPPGVITGEIESQSRSDEAERCIRLDGGPLIELDPRYYKRDNIYRVTHLELRWRRGRLIRAEVSGPALRKDGSDGRRRHNNSWFISARTDDWCPEPPPPWLTSLIDQFGTVPTWQETA